MMRGSTSIPSRSPAASSWLTVISLMSIAAAPLNAQSVDVMPPELQDLTFSPLSIDVTSSSQIVTVTMHVTDDLSGVGTVQVSFRNDVGGQFVQGFGSFVSGTNLDGMYEAQVIFPQFAANGNWTLSNVFLRDLAGNGTSITNAVLESQGFPVDLTVTTSSPDIMAPIIAGTAIAPNAIDVSAGDQDVTVTLDIMDDASGVAFTQCPAGNPFSFNFFPITLSSPSGIQNQFFPSFPMALVSGTPLSGMWEGTIPVPQYSEAGTWIIQGVTARDCVGNFQFLNTAQLAAMGFPTEFDVTSSPEDTQAPNLVGLSYQPIAINTATSFQNVTVTLHITDDLAGTEFSPTTPNLTFFEVGIQFRSPSGNQFRNRAFGFGWSLVSGTVFDGEWEGQVFFPQFSEDGTWNIDFLSIKDAARNIRSFNTADLAALGFPTTLEVIRPSLIPDGNVGPSGGTIEDDTFGPRASVTLPPGAVSGPTDIAIDVLTSPLAIPTPTGFQGPGSLYVNIELTPTPSFPLPPPGMTIVLPLPDPLPVGTALNLYKVDPVTGNLTAAQDFFGVDIVGFVDPGGLSATFTGVASLSTVVGLIPNAISVALDIKPGSDENTINLGANGTVPVVIYSTSSFDASTVDPETVALAGAPVARRGNDTPRVSIEDVDGDGLADMVLHFNIQDLDLLSHDVEAAITGLTVGGIQIAGSDAIRIVK